MQKQSYDVYKCNKCGSSNIYLSNWVTDLDGTLTCFKCGETEDALFGISKNGHLITKYRQGNLANQLFL